jgi:GntR family transcriptional regulator, transcriptional repressor for pyruvate dehydrogenase complex
LPKRARSALLRPLAPHRNLAHDIAERLAGEIARGAFAPGARLPTEQAMVTAIGVSRTVVREAVAALRAQGLVVTRQGAGAFVAEDAARRPFRLAVSGLSSVAEVLRVMELRASVEAEAASLAALRGSMVARQRIAAALAAIDTALARGESATAEDIAFHGAIAEATGNPQFSRFLEYIGHFVIPRQSGGVIRGQGRRDSRGLFQKEHRAIVTAILSRDAAGAREAMRCHLAASQARYRYLMAGATLGTRRTRKRA